MIKEFQHTRFQKVFDLRIKLLCTEAIVPQYSHPGDSGLNLFSCESKQILPGESTRVKIGIAIELPQDMEAQVRPRSGLAFEHQITVLNSPGTIDNEYRGEIQVLLINHGKEVFVVEYGMKIAQLVVAPVLCVKPVLVKHLSPTRRDAGSWGSTGK